MKVKLLSICIAGALFLVSGADARVVTIASGSNGSLGFNTGQAVAKIANQEAHIIARTQPLTNYLPLINDGEIDFGFVNAVEAEFALTGTGNYKGHLNPNLRIVGTMFPLVTGLAVPANIGVKTIADLRAKAGKLRIASEYTGSTIIPYYIAGALANGDLSYGDFQKVPVSSFVQGIHALGGGLVDVALVSLNSGAGKKANVQLRGVGGFRYVSLDASKKGVEAFKKFLPAGNIVSLKANKNIPGMQKPANLISIPWVMLTNKNVSEKLVYEMTKVIAEHNKELGNSFGAFKRANLKMMAPFSRLKYHPGAIKYYKEANIPIGKQ